ncbi:preprotein translocase subunit SecA [Candidatus Peregrinibacteria bacterium]|jgi:preprotein translocase subunit SecA|nr:preprotein translocase subunit SecA [Candidatus Peregrinibacteria bacterium]
MLQKIYKKIFGDYNEKFVKQLDPILEKINTQEKKYQSLNEADFLKNTELFKKRVENGESLESILVEAFATVKNACRRLTEKKHKFQIGKKEMLWEMIPYDVQLIGGMVLHQGKISEMKTGEGKTLVSVAPMYLNALSGKGVHLVTVNEYLASRDASWMSQVFEYLGMRVGTLKHGQTPEEKREEYYADITYGTNNEFGFDYLRDNMAVKEENQVMRGTNFAIVDEVDSILIDEARTPLIISAPAEESTNKYAEYYQLVKNLEKATHYDIDEKEKTVSLTEEGIKKMEALLNLENIYTERGFEAVHHIESALRAQAVFQRDTDYVVQDDQIVIVDEFTGRLMPGRRYSGGLHQALEAKEKVEIKRESKTLASITFQNFFRLYKKLGGMTGTASTEAKEFAEIYSLDTIEIPTHRKVIRKDKPDAIFKNAHGKYQAIAKRAKEANEKGQPVLIGTISIEKSEILSSLLKKEGITHSILNAKQHAQEAEIITNAGEKGSVTIATNMAGRGTDIKPNTEALEAGGLLVIGTERHESRRIDNQLRGRSGRQGDPGETQFFVSMDDDLMRLFGSERMQKMMETLGLPDDMPIENKMISNAIESAQKKVEVRNFEIRKHILQYDDVMNKHREIIYEKRNSLLSNENVHEDILALIKKFIPQVVQSHTEGIRPEFWNYEEIEKNIKQFGDISPSTTPAIPAETGIHSDKSQPEEITDGNAENISNYYLKKYEDFYSNKQKDVANDEAFHHAEKVIYLRNIDRHWMEHIDEMTRLRETVSLRAYGNKNPLFEYKHEAFEAFKKMNYSIGIQTIKNLIMLQIKHEPIQMVRVAPAVKDLKTNEAEIESEISSSHIIPKSPIQKAASAPNPSSPTTSAPLNVQASPAAKVTQDGVTVYRVEDEASPKIQIPKVGRNDSCPCGSGKKYKKCCGK